MAGALSPSRDDNSLETDYCQGYSSDEESEMGFSEIWLTVSCLFSRKTNHFGLRQGLTHTMLVMSILCLKPHARMMCQSAEL